MASKKKPSSNQKRGFGAKNLKTEYSRAEALIARGKWTEARDFLEDLSQNYPKEKDILIYLVNLYYELQDYLGYERACERVLELDPNNSYVTYGIAGAYLNNLHPILAFTKFREALDRWPNHEQAPIAREALETLQPLIPGLLAEMNLQGEGDMAIAILHEKGQAYLEQGQYEKAKQIEQDVIRQQPNFYSAWNNLSLISFTEGNLEEAIATSQKVLDMQPDNIHALSNLTRYHCLNGQIEEAQIIAQRLKESQANAWEGWVKKLEALSYLGDDEGILAVFKQAEAADYLKSSASSALFHHLVAVAMARTGQISQARKQWQKALKRSPNFELALENLEDINQLSSQRHAPWAFGFSNWVTRQTIEDLTEVWRSLSKSEDETENQLTAATQHYLATHPYLIHLIPVLLDRGDKSGREFAFLVAKNAKTPEMLKALLDFALSQRGPDDMRYEAALELANAGLLPGERARLWIQGDWQEIALLSYEFHSEPLIEHSPQVKGLIAQVVPLLQQDDVQQIEQAELLLKQALSVEPDAPDLLNNLAIVYQLQEKTEESYRLKREVAERYPDYILGRLSLAQIHLEQNEIEAAGALLKPLIHQKRFHFSEFNFFSNLYLELLIKENNESAATSWLNLWEQVDPENSNIFYWKVRLKDPDTLRSMKKK